MVAIWVRYFRLRAYCHWQYHLGHAVEKSAKQNPFTLALVEKGNVAAVAWKQQFALASGLCFVTVAIAVYFSSLRDT